MKNKTNEQHKTKLINTFNFLLSLLVLLAPLFVTGVLIKAAFNATLNEFQLSSSVMWNDELAYWHEINTFKEFGFKGGYYSIQEFVAPSTFFRYAVHGPAYAAFMGTLTRVFGWYQHSPPFYNLIFVSLGLLLFLLITKPNIPQKVFLLLAMVLCYSILYHLPSSLQESFHHLLAFIIGAVLIRLSTTKGPSIWLVVLGFLAISCGALLRVHWAIVFFPLIYLLKIKKDWKWFFLSLLIALPIVGLFVFIQSRWMSSSTTPFLYQLSNTDQLTLRNLAVTFIKQVIGNIKDYLLLEYKINLIAIVQRYLILFLSFGMFYLVLKKRNQFIIPLFILVSEVLLFLFFNDISGTDFRHFAPYVIITILFFVTNIDFKDVKTILVLFLIFSALAWPRFQQIYLEYHEDHFNHDPSLRDARMSLSPALASLDYDENAIDPWCNSLITDIRWDPTLLSIPAGIGVNYIWYEDQVVPPIRSHYLFVTPEKVEKYQLTGKVKEMQTEGGRILYEQLYDGCI